MFPNVDVIDNIQRYEIYTILLPVLMAATSMNALCKYCIKYVDVILILIANLFF
jgi:hypothetical protein